MWSRVSPEPMPERTLVQILADEMDKSKKLAPDMRDFKRLPGGESNANWTTRYLMDLIDRDVEEERVKIANTNLEQALKKGGLSAIAGPALEDPKGGKKGKQGKKGEKGKGKGKHVADGGKGKGARARTASAVPKNKKKNQQQEGGGQRPRSQSAGQRRPEICVFSFRVNASVTPACSSTLRFPRIRRLLS